jgi:glutamate/tyrosine decarboxylase-like PLP-dependent enzyme
MSDRIKELEKTARRLEPDAGRRALLLEHVLDYAETFIEQIADAPAYVAGENGGRGLYHSPISEEGIDVETALDLLGSEVDTPGLNPTSGRFLGYIPGGALFHSALGDFLAAVSNRYAGFYFASPGAVRLENMLLHWMADLIGYPASCGGNLTSGGSIANLVGVVTARDAHGVEAEEVSRAVVYFTEHMHHSVNKALRIAGLGRCVKRIIPVDENYRMQAPVLAQAIERDRETGLRPWLVVASAGTTNTGSVDPLPAVADIVQANGLWLHIDGAYGAFFVLCQEGKQILSGMDRSHSIVMDPHKTLFLPYGTGAVLVKDRHKLYQSHYYQADYMQDANGLPGQLSPDELSPADFSPELTKHFRGLRLWLPLKLLGLAPFRAALEEKMLLARYFHHKIQEVDGFEAGPFPDLSVVTYRYLPRRGDANAFNRELTQEIQRDGRIFISSTMVDGQFVLRLAVGVYRTHLDDIDQTLQILAQKANDLEETR